jgi:hypothetical protein
MAIKISNYLWKIELKYATDQRDSTRYNVVSALSKVIATVNSFEDANRIVTAHNDVLIAILEKENVREQWIGKVL